MCTGILFYKLVVGIFTINSVDHIFGLHYKVLYDPGKFCGTVCIFHGYVHFVRIFMF